MRVEQTVLVALVTGVLTAATALTASWLTARATIRAARVQVESAVALQRRERTRELRRTAYVEFVTVVSEFRWRTRELARRAASGDPTALVEYRGTRNDAGRELARARYVVHMEGPDPMRQAADRVRGAVDRLADDVDVALGLSDADQIRATVRDSRAALRQRTEEFLALAQETLTG